MVNQTIKGSARFFRALGDETRLIILRKLLKGELCACRFADIAKKDQTTVSRHLKILTDAGILKYEKRGRNIIYSIKDEKVKEFLLNASI